MIRVEDDFDVINYRSTSNWLSKLNIVLRMILCSVLVGSGAQLLCMSVALLTFALMGLLSPDSRGSIVSAFILLFVFMGSFAGYYSSLTYKMFRGTDWKGNTLLTASLYPGLVAAVLFVLNAALWLEGSSGAIPFGTLFTLLFLWFCVSVPLVSVLFRISICFVWLFFHNIVSH